jgi:hypothetical protein
LEAFKIETLTRGAFYPAKCADARKLDVVGCSVKRIIALQEVARFPDVEHLAAVNIISKQAKQDENIGWVSDIEMKRIDSK